MPTAVVLRGPQRVCLHAERERCARALEGQLSDYNLDCERMRVRIDHTSAALNHTSAALNKLNASGGSAVSHASGTSATAAARMKQSYLWRSENCDVPVKSWAARDIQFETLDAVRECLLKWVAQMKLACVDDDAEGECDEGSARTLVTLRIASHLLEYLR